MQTVNRDIFREVHRQLDGMFDPALVDEALYAWQRCWWTVGSAHVFADGYCRTHAERGPEWGYSYGFICGDPQPLVRCRTLRRVLHDWGLWRAPR